MTTTIQISNETKQLLVALKAGKRKSYDEIIQELIKKEHAVPKSMFGTMKNFGWNKEKDRMQSKYD